MEDPFDKSESAKELRERTGAGIMDCKRPFRKPMGIWKSVVYLRSKITPQLKQELLKKGW